MPWIKVDDHYDEHHKFADAGPLGHALWLAGMAYCNRNLTDGYIPWSVARKLLSWEFLGAPENGSAVIYRVAVVSQDGHGDEDYEVIDAKFVVDILVRVGLWEEDGYGYRVHDYDRYQPTKAQVEADRAAKVAAGQAGGQASARARGQATAQAAPKQPRSSRSTTGQAQSNPVPVPVPVPPALGSDEPSAGDSARPTDAYGVMLDLESLTHRPFGYREGHQIHDTLTGDVGVHGAERMAGEYRRFVSDHPGSDIAQVVFGVHNELHPLIRTVAPTKADLASERAESIARAEARGREWAARRRAEQEGTTDAA